MDPRSCGIRSRRLFDAMRYSVDRSVVLVSNQRLRRIWVALTPPFRAVSVNSLHLALSGVSPLEFPVVVNISKES